MKHKKGSEDPFFILSTIILKIHKISAVGGKLYHAYQKKTSMNFKIHKPHTNPEILIATNALALVAVRYANGKHFNKPTSWIG